MKFYIIILSLGLCSFTSLPPPPTLIKNEPILNNNNDNNSHALSTSPFSFLGPSSSPPPLSQHALPSSPVPCPNLYQGVSLSGASLLPLQQQHHLTTSITTTNHHNSHTLTSAGGGGSLVDDLDFEISPFELTLKSEPGLSSLLTTVSSSNSLNNNNINCISSNNNNNTLSSIVNTIVSSQNYNNNNNNNTMLTVSAHHPSAATLLSGGAVHSLTMPTAVSIQEHTIKYQLKFSLTKKTRQKKILVKLLKELR